MLFSPLSLRCSPGVLRNICLACLLFNQRAIAYTAIPRWGQATAVISDALFVHGGKTDAQNAYSYTSAPNDDDLLFLDLSLSFSTASPPWALISSSSNSSTPQGGPPLAWHSLSAFNTSMLLLFGGDPGPNSSPAITTLPDSALLLNVYNRLVPVWISEAQSWASEPMRRIHHSASSVDGKIWLIGGMKDDGSNNALSDHWVFDPNGPSFTQLPSTNGPPDLYGHVSIVLPNGLLIVFGGYSQSMALLLPFSTIWALDTTESTLTWSLLYVSTGTLPSPRRGFAAVILEGDKILIHGGADATLETVYSDGWILDTTTNPMTWSSVNALSQLGPRIDHFAVAMGPQVVFGFGYSSNGPAPAAVQVYDSNSGAFVPSFTPQPASTTNTIPGPIQTGTNGGSSGNTYPPGNSPTNQPGQTGTGTGVHPTSTDGGGGGNGSDSSKSHATAIALGTTFGVLGLVVGAIATSVYLSKRDHPLISRNRFHLLGGSGDDDENSMRLEAAIPTAGGQQEKPRQGPAAWLPRNSTILHQLGIGGGVGAGAAAATARQRRDMLADEDTREFGTHPESSYGVRRDGSAGSTWSIQSVGALIKSRIRSREPSGSGSRSRLTTPWQEKGDPFGDDATAALMMVHDERTGYGVRPQDRRQPSYATTVGTSSYVDPFADSVVPGGDVEDGSSDGIAEADDGWTHLKSWPPTLQTALPLSTGVHTLSPLTEQTSRTTLFDPSSSNSSHEHPVSPFDTSRGTSFTSYHDAALPRPTSIVGATSAPTQPMRRSDSWWSRFARTSFLDRRASGAGPPHSRMFDFRDPNPPPRLVAIEESMHSKSPESPESAGSRPSPSRKASRRGKGYSHTGHGRSVSSLQTADSEAIEKMGGNIDVVQRMGTTGSRESHGTAPSSGRTSPDGESRWAGIQRPLSVVPSSGPSKETSEDNTAVESPIQMAHVETFIGDIASGEVTPRRPSPPKLPSSGGAVSARIQDFERRMSQDAEMASPKSPLSPSARNTRKREEHPSKNRVTVNYGLVQRPSLYVANPDHSASPSSDS